jgi:hypothetical protein
MIELDEDFEPVIEEKTLATISGQEAQEQWVRVNATARLESILSDYAQSDIPQKIKLELTRLARESGFVDQIESIQVSRTADDDGQGYEVSINYVGNDEYKFAVTD